MYFLLELMNFVYYYFYLEPSRENVDIISITIVWGNGI